MSGKTKVWIFIMLALAAIVGGMFVVARDTRPDEEQIRTALQESIDLSREGRPGGVLDLLSSQFKIAGIVNLSPAAIAEQIRKNKPDIKFSNEILTVEGSSAQMMADVKIAGSVGIGPIEKSFDVPVNGVVLVFRKEDARKFLFIPAKVWKLTEVQLPADFVPELDL